jgi:hypothetical protein
LKNHGSLYRLLTCVALGAAALLLATPEVRSDKRVAKAQSKKTKNIAPNRSGTTSNGPTAKVPAAPSLSRVLTDAATVDRMINANLAKNKTQPNRSISDEVFVRRIYLDIVGRIPTYDETTTFLGSKDKAKRSTLIDKLLASEGYVSHQFNYWADILRAITRTRGSPAIGVAYTNWIKTSIRQNKPYDRFVYEMLTAKGHPTDNGGSGYYMRDDGMPLDNMSNTVRVFLGTQIGCAQCHDHPFDSWTQYEFYEMAAYTYGLTYRNYDPKYRQLFRAANKPGISNGARQGLRNLVRPLRYELSENTRRSIRLPKDYQYKDAKPKAQIKPHTLFGSAGSVTQPTERLKTFGAWMVSDKNPRFTKVIANRLWKRAFGVGLIEPIDDIKDDTKASIPPLMDFLTKRMSGLGFDLRQFQRILYNSKAYQREISRQDYSPGTTYLFAGPLMRRMSAEQIWDSMLALTIPDPDERKGYSGLTRQSQQYIASLRQDLKTKSTTQIIKQAEDLFTARTARQTFFRKRGELYKQMQKARDKGDSKTVAKIQKQMRDMQRQSMDQRKTQKGKMESMAYFRSQMRETDPRWKSFATGLVRASELQSPAPPGHFLRQFGQSDRQTIQAANTDPTVTQILTLLNGPIYGQMWNRDAALRRSLEKAKTAKAKIETVFLCIYSRRPTAAEYSLAARTLKADPRRGATDLVWALLNTRQFAFIQ